MHFGEGDYSDDRELIRQLLVAAHPGGSLPPATDVPDKTPTAELSPETYVGYDRLQYLVPSNAVVQNAPAVYHFPASLPLGGLGLSGTWTEHAQEATAGSGARLELGFLAQDVYLVLGGTGTIRRLGQRAPYADHRRRRDPPALHPRTRPARTNTGRSSCRFRRGSRPTTSPSADPPPLREPRHGHRDLHALFGAPR